MTAMSPSDAYPAPAVPYATPAPRPAAKVWAGASILFGGLCLILLGGCFLIGVMGVVESLGFNPGAPASPPPLTAPQMILMIALYLIAFASFAGAVLLLFIGTRGLLKVMRAT